MDDDKQEFAKREDFIRAQLEYQGLIPSAEECARRHGFKDAPATVQFFIAEFARDEQRYNNARQGAYEPEQYALLIDFAMMQLAEKVKARANKPNSTPDNDSSPPRGR